MRLIYRKSAKQKSAIQKLRLLACVASGALFVSSSLASAAPTTAHPRLWITQADVTRLAGWTTTSNAMWQSGLFAAAQAGVATANAHWNWTTGVPDSGWEDVGSNSYEGMPTEAYAEMFAFMSLIDPKVANRPGWAMRAHTMLMWAMNQANWAVLHGDDSFMPRRRKERTSRGRSRSPTKCSPTSIRRSCISSPAARSR